MVEALQSKHSENAAGIQSNDREPIPPLTQAVDESDGWITFDSPKLYVYAGQGPYTARYAATCHAAYAALIFY